MICSMTAFGRIQKEGAGFSVMVEIRTLNSRFLDIVVRLPKKYLEFEELLRKQIAQSMRRGRIEIFVQIDPLGIEQKAPQLNMPLALHYWEQLQSLHRQLPGTDAPKLEHLLRIPYVFEAIETSYDREALDGLLRAATEEALRQIDQMRCREGSALREDCLVRLNVIQEEMAILEARKDLIVEEFHKRLRERVQELLGDKEIDANRLLQEVVILAERSDINEEVVRLKSHVDQMRTLLSDSKPVDGRRLDFLTQELHREANTIGCKTADIEAIQAVVKIKGEIGKLKEQVQNVE